MNDKGLQLVGDTIEEKSFEAIRSFYSLGKVLNVLRETRGLINTTLHIDSQRGKHMATLFRSKSVDQAGSIAKIMLALECIPIAKPIKGADGHVLDLDGIPVILCPFIEGTSAVTEDHSTKSHIERTTHENISALFWELHRQLRKVQGHGGQLPKQTDSSLEHLAENIKMLAHSLNLPQELRKRIDVFYRVCAENAHTDIHRDTLVHSDFERQNVLLASDGKINGIVDFDALKNGDLLYEFAHALYNFACCDPEPNNYDVDIYLGNFIKAGILPVEGLKRIYSLMCRFCIEDLLGFLEIAHQRPVNIQKLIEHYEGALYFAHNYFRP